MGPPKLGSLVAGQYVAPYVFKWGIDYLKNGGWECVSLADCIEMGRMGQSLSNRFAITFDDGYLSVYEHACPALRERGMTATIYVVANSIGGINDWDKRAGDQEEKVMTASQVRELSSYGFEIGAHTLTHPHLTNLDDDQLRSEIIDSKHKLEDLIGKEVASFSYPYGDYDSRVLNAAIAAGYSNAVSTRLGIILEGTSLFEIPRVNVRWNAIGPLLMRKIRRAERASGVRP